MAVAEVGRTKRATAREIAVPFLEARKDSPDLANATARLRRALRRDFYTIDDAKEAAELLQKNTPARMMIDAVISETEAPITANTVSSLKARLEGHKTSFEKSSRDSSAKHLAAIRGLLVDILEALTK